MWLDNASDIDILFYDPYAELIFDIVNYDENNPLTIGIFGLWGAGKSTLLNLISKKIGEKGEKLYCIHINAWLYETYEDAKTSIIEALLNEMKKNQSIAEKIKDDISDMFKNVNYIKLGLKLLSNSIPFLQSVVENKAPEKVNGINYISNFKERFEKMVGKSDINNLIVLVDDLDRCTPEKIIESLEAIKLFLSVKRTTFIVAADEKVIEYAIQKKYPVIENSEVDISTEYIEKIIQLPIYIPKLSSKDIENYLLLLIVQKYIKKEKFQELLANIFNGHLMLEEDSISKKKIIEMINEIKDPYKVKGSFDKMNEDIEVIDNIRSIIASSLKGNPRQTKRFLNTFYTKKALSNIYFNNDLDMKILVKLLVLQKISSDCFEELCEWDKQFDKKNEKLEKLTNDIKSEKEDKSNPKWKTSEIIRWFDSEPYDLYSYKLDKYFYLSREKIKKESYYRLSDDARKIVEELSYSFAGNISAIIKKLKQLDEREMKKVINILIKKISKGNLAFFKIDTLFMEFEEDRDKILNEIERIPKNKLTPSLIPYFVRWAKIENEKVIQMLNNMKGKNLKEKIYIEIIDNLDKE